jgi:hypothetical protein
MPGDPSRVTELKGSKRAYRYCEGFRMPAADERCGRHGRPASETLQGRKPTFARTDHLELVDDGAKTNVGLAAQ